MARSVSLKKYEAANKRARNAGKRAAKRAAEARLHGAMAGLATAGLLGLGRKQGWVKPMWGMDPSLLLGATAVGVALWKPKYAATATPVATASLGMFIHSAAKSGEFPPTSVGYNGPTGFPMMEFDADDEDSGEL